MERSSFRARLALAAQAALIAALGDSAPKGPPMSASGNTGQRRVSPGTRAGRRLNSRLYRNRGTAHEDNQAGASLRRRMGGNAQRILHARQGLIFNDDPSALIKWVPSPTVLPEEVEAVAKVYRKLTPSDYPVTFYITEIRGHRVQLWPYMLGPLRFTVLKGTERFYDRYSDHKAYDPGE